MDTPYGVKNPPNQESQIGKEKSTTWSPFVDVNVMLQGQSF